MKRVLFFLAFVSFTSLLFTGCEEDLCENTICENGGTCDEETGNCICPAGFEGDSCESASIDKFKGDWTAVDNCPSDTFNYDATIQDPVAVSTDLEINNFGGFGVNLGFGANLDSTATTIIIPLTDPGNGVLTSGEGTISADNSTISWTYTVEDATGAQETCTGTWTK